MKLDEGEIGKTSFFGGICTFILMIVIVLYSYLKLDVLIGKKDVDILSTINDVSYTPDDVFNYKNGLAFSAGFTAYDSNQEPILEPEYGEIIFNHYTWGPQPDGGFKSERKRIPSH